jgi:hypothetical protein
VMFSIEWRERNPDSSIAWRFDWADSTQPAGAKATPLIHQVCAEDPNPVLLTRKGETESTTGPEKPKDSSELTLDAGSLFQWRDSVRPEASGGYAVQEISQTASTRFPRQCPIYESRTTSELQMQAW